MANKPNYRLTDTHCYFHGSFLSNFKTAPFVVDFIRYTNSEQYYMSKKATVFQDWESWSKIMGATSPAMAKAFGREVKSFNFGYWDQLKFEIMVKGVYNKFKQNMDLQNQLLLVFNKGSRSFVEASPTDPIWGVGLHQDDDAILNEANWKGENLLGKVLNEVAAKIYLERQNVK